jgi:hypothetical protein
MFIYTLLPLPSFPLTEDGKITSKRRYPCCAEERRLLGDGYIWRTTSKASIKACYRKRRTDGKKYFIDTRGLCYATKMPFLGLSRPREVEIGYWL